MCRWGGVGFGPSKGVNTRFFTGAKTKSARVRFDEGFPLRWLYVKRGTRERYQSVVDRFLSVAKGPSLVVDTTDDLEDAFELYCNTLFQRYGGRVKQRVVDALNGLYREFPRARGRLNASAAALRSWSKVRPPMAYLPIPYHVPCVSYWCVRLMYLTRDPAARIAGQATLVAHHCLMRVGEILRLSAGDLVFGPSDQAGCVHQASITVRHAKTGQNQHVRVLCSQVAQLLKRIHGRVLATHGKAGRIFLVSYSVLRTRFRNALRSASLGSHRYVFHSLRHGGATELAIGGWDLHPISILEVVGFISRLLSVIYRRGGNSC